MLRTATDGPRTGAGLVGDAAACQGERSTRGEHLLLALLRRVVHEKHAQYRLTMG